MTETWTFPHNTVKVDNLYASNAPTWAQRLTEVVLREAGWTPEQYRAVTLTWRYKHSKWSRLTLKERAYFAAHLSAAGIERFKRIPRPSGTAYLRTKRIVVTAGADTNTNMVTLVHELAHLIAGEDHHHDLFYWRLVWRLYRRHHLMDAALKFETTAKSKRVAQQMLYRMKLVGEAK